MVTAAISGSKQASVTALGMPRSIAADGSIETFTATINAFA
jgi:hypothetical protein